MTDIFNLENGKKLDIDEYTIGFSDSDIKELFFLLLKRISLKATVEKDEYGNLFYGIEAKSDYD